MRPSTWELEQRGAGRTYQLPKDLVIKYEDRTPILEFIMPQLKDFVKLESSVRLVLDSPYVNGNVTTIAVPFEGEDDTIYRNLALMVAEQLWGYYLSADPQGTHHGLSNLVFDGGVTNLIRRETEKFLTMIRTRNDMAARLMNGYTMACETDSFEKDVFLKHVVKDSLNIHLGVRMYTYGLGVNRVTSFLPIADGGDAVDRVYYNLEHIIHQNLVAYDELHPHALPVSEELILRELESVLDRARSKQNTRLKVINGLKLHTVLLDDASAIQSKDAADMYYDKIYRVDLMEEASQRSRDMFATSLIRSTEITQDALGKNVDNLKMDERVYIERPAAKDITQERETVAVSVTTYKDGLSEL
ncbi:MAG: hypothetical protein OEV94_00430 [Deltaproteobacteria bacterium]|nr:hypothetical protein [Deltaproteobacteria bacterium]